MHYCSKDNGSSGSPILNLKNNKVIGIHKGTGDEKKNYNYGTLLKYPLNDFINKIKRKNIIIEQKYINNNNINEDNQIFSSFENFKRENDLIILPKIDMNISNLNNKICTNNNNILLEIINDLEQIINYNKDNIFVKRLSDIIIKMNTIVNENKKNTELIRNDISKLYKQMNKQFERLNINKIEIKYNEKSKEGRKKYIGEVLNGIPNGKGIMYWNFGERHEGEWKNDKADGKGIRYFPDDDRYEGDFKEGLCEGKGIYYYKNGDREMCDFCNDKEIRKHVMLTKDGEVKINNY